MKYRNTRHQLDRKSVKIRAPGDYPWHLLTHLCEFGSRCYPGAFDPLRFCIRRRDIDGLDSWIADHSLQRISCGTYNDSGLPALLYLTAAVVKKYPMWSSSEERIQRAMDGFKGAEQSCKAFNDTLHSRMYSPSGDLHPVFKNARQLIYKILGYVLPPQTELDYGSRHGPGSTSSLRRKHAHLYYKYNRWPYSLTPGAERHAREMITSDQRWIGALEDSYRNQFNVEPWKILDQDLFWSRVLNIVPGNRITTVPKDGRKDRPIAMEPTLNIYLQLGVHEFIRKRLKRWGIDIESQTMNRRMAHKGSIDGSFATIDLSSASDSVSLTLVKELFPPDWYQYMYDIRSPEGTLPSGESIKYEKLSSMGNGYTFAVETLVFFALAVAVQIEQQGRYLRGSISVFGDDIIVPNDMFNRTCQILECAGFTVNTEKSFASGSVRESCGVDCLAGFDINPVEIDRIPQTVLDLYCDRNRLHYWFKTVFGLSIPDSLDKYLLGLIPERFHIYGPEDDDVFDTYIHSDERLKSHKVYQYIHGHKSYWSGWKFTSITPIVPSEKPKDFFFGRLLASHRPGGDLVSRWSARTPFTGSRYEIPQTERIRYKVGTCLTSYMRGYYRLDRSASPT